MAICPGHFLAEMRPFIGKKITFDGGAISVVRFPFDISQTSLTSIVANPKWNTIKLKLNSLEEKYVKLYVEASHSLLNRSLLIKFVKMKPKGHLATHNFFKKEQKKTAVLIPYSALIVLSFGVAVFSVSDLEWEDHISIRTGLVLFFSGLVFFSSLYLAMNILFLHTSTGRKMVKTYGLSNSNVYDISNKQVSAVQALFCCITGGTSVCYSCSRDVLKTSHYISEAYGWFGAAYFFYDIWSMYEVYSSKVTSAQMNGDAKKVNRFLCGLFKTMNYLKSNAVIVFHHIFIGGFGFLVITYLRGGLGDCFFGFVYLMEASTPFVSLRGILSKIGLKNTPIYVVNGLMMLVVFFLCRIAMFPYVIYMYSLSIRVDFISAIYTLPRGCLISITILLLPQLYWFYLMLSGATKVLKKTTSNNNLKNE